MTARRRKTQSDEEIGRLRIGDMWNAITILALSQTNPLKAIAEMVKVTKPGGCILIMCRLDPAETLFIDDTLGHVESAGTLGIHGHHLKIGEGEQIMDLFEE